MPTGSFSHWVFNAPGCAPFFLSYPSYTKINCIKFFFLLSYSLHNFFRAGEGVIMDYPIWTLFIYIYLSSTYINRLRYILLLTFILSLTTTIISRLYSVFSVSVFLSIYIYIGSFPMAQSVRKSRRVSKLRRLGLGLVRRFRKFWKSSVP